MEIGIAHYLWPPRYVGEHPHWENTGPQPLPDPQLLGEIVTSVNLPHGIRARVFRDGMIVFALGDLAQSPYESDAPTSVEWWEKGARLANAHLACLAAAVGTFMLAPSGVATLSSIMQAQFDTGKFHASSDYTGSGARVALHFARMGTGDLGDWRFYRGRPLVTADQIDRSFELLDALLKREPREAVLLRAELITRSQAALLDGDASGALVYAWTAVEGVLGDLYERYLDERAKREVGRDPSGNARKLVNRDRRERLEDTTQMTAWHRAEILSLAERLPFALYREITTCRQARNAWLHNGKEATREQAVAAIRTAQEMFKLAEGIDLCQHSP